MFRFKRVTEYVEHSQDTSHSLYSDIKVRFSASFIVQSQKIKPKVPLGSITEPKSPEMFAFQQSFILSTKNYPHRKRIPHFFMELWLTYP